MIGNTQIIQSKDFNIGLFTRSDIIQTNPDLSPNCMNIKWYFDNAIGKRLGSSTTNSVIITSGGGGASWIIDGGASLNTNLLNYFNLDEVSGTRFDSVRTNNLLEIGTIPTPSITGIRNNGVAVSAVAGNILLRASGGSTAFRANTSNFSYSFWLFQSDTASKTWIQKGSEFSVQSLAGGSAAFTIQDITLSSVSAISTAMLLTNSWNNVTFYHVTNAYIGINVNNGQATTSLFASIASSGNGEFEILGTVSNRRIDEIGYWNKLLSATEISNLYGGGSGNTYTNIQSINTDSWYSFDFGAGAARWLTVAMGSGILASSNAGTTWVTVASSRTNTWQYMDRSKNVLIATSDAYDPTLYWAGSAGTFASILALNSAPSAKFSINYQGFLILLNYMNSLGIISPRGFSYADENTQLTSTWSDRFDLPSSDDDETTGPFILNKFLYVSTKRKIFRLNYVGGNPDWEYIQVANFGFVPRTIKVFNVKGAQVATGLDWSRKLRTFYGFESDIVSDNVENFNNYCEFAMDNISLSGSGLLVSNAEFDPNEQEYRLNLAIGAQSTQTTHALVFNARTLALYPYANQPFNTMCVAESAGRQFLMAFDRSGLCHIQNSGNLDAGIIPINDVYDSPLLFKNSPSEVTKNKQVNLFFTTESAGTIYYQERFDFSNVFSQVKPLKNYLGEVELKSTDSSIIITRTVDLPSVQNIYQYRLTTSSGTANPYKLIHYDLFNSSLGVGRGK